MRKIAIPDEGIESLFGTYDENLKHLETLFNVRIRTNGHELIVEGEAADVARAERVLDQLAALMRGGYKLAKGDVKTAAQLVAQDEAVDLARLLPARRAARRGQAAGRCRRASTSGATSTRSSSTTSSSASVRPAPARPTWRWRRPSSFLLPKRVSRIILARPAVEAGEKLGFLPGDLQEKVNPYLRPLYDALYDMLELERVERLLERGTIEVAPIAFMRGRTLNDAFVILDEAQNTTSEQMKMFLTRLGFGSKAVDHRRHHADRSADRPARPGLIEAMKVVGDIEGIAFVHFDERDVVRHQLVQQIVKAYEAFTVDPDSETPARRRSPTARGRRGRATPGLARWLARASRRPRARGDGGDRARQRRAHARAQPLPAQGHAPTSCRSRRRTASSPARIAPAPVRSGRHRHRDRRRAAPGARGRSLLCRPSCASWRCTGSCTCSATITTTRTTAADGPRRGAAAPQGRAARRA